MTSTPLGYGTAGAREVSSEATVRSRSPLSGTESAQPAMGTITYETHAIDRRRAKTMSPECPECGSERCVSKKPGRDPDGAFLRQRKCQDCDCIFTTVELVLWTKQRGTSEQALTKFHEVDEASRDRNTELARLRRLKKFGKVMRQRSRHGRSHRVLGSVFVYAGTGGSSSQQGANTKRT